MLLIQYEGNYMNKTQALPRMLLATLLICNVAASFALEATATNNNKQQQTITIAHLSKDDDLKEVEQLFIRTFKDAYKDIPLDVLKIENLDAFLKAAFEDEPEELKKPNVFCTIAKNANSIVGVISFEPTEQQNEVYIRQLAIDPAIQKQGIGSTLVASITKQLPATTRIIVATRRVNKPAWKFYEKLGFQVCEQVPHELNPERYVGFEKELKN